MTATDRFIQSPLRFEDYSRKELTAYERDLQSTYDGLEEEDYWFLVEEFLKEYVRRETVMRGRTRWRE